MSRKVGSTASVPLLHVAAVAVAIRRQALALQLAVLAAQLATIAP
jgi:hypothetical protein